MLQNAPKFEGKSEESYHRWQDKFLNYAHLMDWPMAKLSLIIQQCLSGRALIFYNSLTSVTKANLQDLFSALEQRFGIASKNVLTRLQELNQKMTSTESIADYARRLEDIFDKFCLFKVWNQTQGPN